MALMMSSLYDALRAANVDDERARKAADEVANYDNQISDLRSDVKLLKWMLWFNLALSVAILFKLFA